MDSIFAYILMLVPGLIIILINERIGFHPSAKYTNIEKTVMAILFSIPVLIINLLILALVHGDWGMANINALQKEVKSAVGLLVYILSSLFWSYIVCCVWHDYVKKMFVVDFVNQIRNTEGKSSIGDGLVWENAFHGKDPQAVMVMMKDEKLYGSLIDNSENISNERSMLLTDSKAVEDIITKYNIPVDQIYVDTKSGVAVKIFDSEKFKENYDSYMESCDSDE